MLSICSPLPVNDVNQSLWPAERLSKLEAYLLTDKRERFGRILLTWHEKKADGKVLTHDYAACVDTQNWLFFFDCRPRKIFAKCLGQLCVRPLHALAKTIYHVSMIPILVEIRKTYQREQSFQVCFINSVRSLADIVRTPLYGIALVVTTVAVLIIGVFSPTSLYEGRSWLGRIEQLSNWGEKHTNWTLAPCFQPFSLAILDKYHYQHKDTVYELCEPLAENPYEAGIQVSLSNFARSLIRHRRTVRNLFDGCLLLDDKTAYVSSILEVVPDTEAWGLVYQEPCQLSK